MGAAHRRRSDLHQRTPRSPDRPRPGPLRPRQRRRRAPGEGLGRELLGKAVTKAVVSQRRNHDDRNGSVDHLDPAARRSTADLAIQQRLGLLPQRWRWYGVGHHFDLGAAWTFLAAPADRYKIVVAAESL